MLGWILDWWRWHRLERRSMEMELAQLREGFQIQKILADERGRQLAKLEAERDDARLKLYRALSGLPLLEVEPVVLPVAAPPSTPQQAIPMSEEEAMQQFGREAFALYGRKASRIAPYVQQKMRQYHASGGMAVPPPSPSQSDPAAQQSVQEFLQSIQNG